VTRSRRRRVRNGNPPRHPIPTDPDGRAPPRINAASVRATALTALGAGTEPRPDAAEREGELRDLVIAHAVSGSGLAATLIARWETERTAFWLVEPVAAG
jgi:hypothetical protein